MTHRLFRCVDIDCTVYGYDSIDVKLALNSGNNFKVDSRFISVLQVHPNIITFYLSLGIWDSLDSNLIEALKISSVKCLAIKIKAVGVSKPIRQLIDVLKVNLTIERVKLLQKVHSNMTNDLDCSIAEFLKYSYWSQRVKYLRSDPKISPPLGPFPYYGRLIDILKLNIVDSLVVKNPHITPEVLTEILSLFGGTKIRIKWVDGPMLDRVFQAIEKARATKIDIVSLSNIHPGFISRINELNSTGKRVRITKNTRFKEWPLAHDGSWYEWEKKALFSTLGRQDICFFSF